MKQFIALLLFFCEGGQLAIYSREDREEPVLKHACKALARLVLQASVATVSLTYLLEDSATPVSILLPSIWTV